MKQQLVEREAVIADRDKTIAKRPIPAAIFSRTRRLQHQFSDVVKAPLAARVPHGRGVAPKPAADSPM